VWLEGFGKLIKFKNLIRSQTHDLPPCTIMLQPTRRTIWKMKIMITAMVARGN
jgi:hypothetical protein